jgi:hypothetical protein
VQTQAYQRNLTDAVADGEPQPFPGPVRRRLSAEQVWDSLMVLAVPDVDRPVDRTPTPATAFYEKHAGSSPEELAAMAKEAGGISQRVRDLSQRATELRAAMKGRPDPKLRAEMQAIVKERDELRDTVSELSFLRPQRNQRADQALARAADLPQPAPPGHLLRILGQSDRQVIDNANASPSIPQALSLMNGIVDQRILKPGSPLSDHLASIPEDRRIAAVWPALLGREATSDELAAVHAAGRLEMADLVWAVINSRDFREHP